MPETVDGVIYKWPSKRKLGRHLCNHRPRSYRRDEARRLEMPSRGRSNQICKAEEVKGAREDDARDTMQRGSDPGDLRLVDGEMGGDGAGETLLDEDGVLERGGKSTSRRLARTRAIGWFARFV